MPNAVYWLTGVVTWLIVASASWVRNAVAMALPTSALKFSSAPAEHSADPLIA
jgi:hypothetical protein